MTNIENKKKKKKSGELVSPWLRGLGEALETMKLKSPERGLAVNEVELSRTLETKEAESKQ